MPHELFIPGAGNVHFSGDLTRAELDAALARLLAADDAERARLVRPYTWTDEPTTITVSVQWYDEPTPTATDIGRLMAGAAAAFKSAIELRIRWFRQAGPPWVLGGGTTTAPGVCLACGDALPPGVLFGRCVPCGAALNAVIWDDNAELPHGRQ